MSYEKDQKRNYKRMCRRGERVGPEILWIVLLRLEEAIMRQDGVWRV